MVVLTQDCDLEQDWSLRDKQSIQQAGEVVTQDKYLLSVLVAPLYNLDHLCAGDHLSELNMKMQLINSERKKLLRSNNTPRYHYIEFPADVPATPAVIDFKHYFSINVETLNSIHSNNLVCSVSELYREDVSQRFASFLSRIGLPE